MAFAIFFPSFAKHNYTVSARVFCMWWGQTPSSKNKWESDVSREQPMQLPPKVAANTSLFKLGEENPTDAYISAWPTHVLVM